MIDDPAAGRSPDEVRRLVFCTGKIYYDLAVEKERAGERRHRAGRRAVSVAARGDGARSSIRYPKVEEVVWAQEEPKNMGAWTFVSPRLRAAVGNALPIRYIGRPERASPAEGYIDVAPARAGADRRRSALAPSGRQAPRRGCGRPRRAVMRYDR